jgi:hypothetical protein
VVGHLGCFHNLAIVNSAAINMGVQVPWSNLCHILLGISPRVVLLDHMVDQCLVSKFFSRVVVLVYIPTNSVRGFLFPRILANTSNPPILTSFSLCACLCLHFSCYKDISHTGLGLTLHQCGLILTNYICNDCISK